MAELIVRREGGSSSGKGKRTTWEEVGSVGREEGPEAGKGITWYARVAVRYGMVRNYGTLWYFLR